MKSVTSLIVKYTVALIAVRLMIFWLWGLGPFGMPQFLPGTPIKLYGLVLVILFVGMLISQFRQIIRVKPSISISCLAFKGVLMCFISEIVLQLVRTFTGDNDRLYTFIYAVSSMTLFNLCLSYLVAYQIKTKNTRGLMMYIAGIILLYNLLVWLFSNFNGR